MKKINWDNIAFWIIVLIFVIVMSYMFITGKAFK